ncbi:methyltransferase domain-containing protein [Gemella sp. GL1.1]|nr:methyltransferase domain-containing protein [Gemella sp. GL1.1]NYS27410.1 methyltransferase domain-containing protein [Gemella sp. GL1]
MEKIERIDYLYKNLKFIQYENHYSVSTDTYLLADFVKMSKVNKKKMIELCSGNGAISLILSYKYNIDITMVEIQEDLVELSKKNIDINEIQRISSIQGDIRNIKDMFRPSSFDYLVCNPPYFPVENMPKTKQGTNHSISRHEILCNLDDVISSIKYLLKQNGRFFMVHRSYRLADIIMACNKYNVGIKRIKFVYSKISSDTSKIVLVEGSISNINDIKIEQPMYIYNEDLTYTSEMKKVYGL